MKINDDFIKEKTGDECVLVPVGETYQNGIFTLNESAERIFDLMTDGKSRDEIIDILSEEYDSDRAQITAFTDEFTEKLLKAGVLIDD